MTRLLSIFALFCGTGMLVTWGYLFATGNVPELKTTPIEATFLHIAEFVTAFALLASGYGLLKGRGWSLRIAPIALGMLLYCSIYSIGVFGQQGNQPATAFFVVIALLTLLFAVWLTLRSIPAASV
jgi:hypothetical protein